MKKLLSCLIVIALASGVSACGNRGKLKTPAQIKAIEAKKARKAEKEQHELDKEKVKDEAMQEPEVSSSPSEDNGVVPLPGQAEPVAVPPPPADMKK